ncbi:MAG: hypothetical protein KAH57_05290, partial [Thermoplasmata archaeon]|nr:hypothetical protein [Thermoplasmata archaeon]
PMEKRSRGKPFYGLFMLSLAGGVGVTIAGDLLTLFLAWEVMTWSALLLIGDGRKGSSRAFKLYLAFGMLSAGAILFMISMIWNRADSLTFADVTAAVAGASQGYQILFLVLGAVAFGSKAALFPMHIWAPSAYAHTEDAFTSFFSGGLSKMGIYGFVLVFDVFIGVAVLTAFGAWNGLTGVGLIVAILGTITAMVGGIKAMFQDDAKKLLAYSSISQLGYIFVGLGVGGSLGVAGALYHVLNHTVFKSLLFMGLGAVVYRTGETRLSRLGGMIHVMPATFWMFLVAVFAAAAIPITSGLASKWLIYESVLERGIGVVVPLLFVASVSAFLYSFRILQGGFMGQLRDEFKDVKEAPITMLIPMGILMAALMIIGFLPGLPMVLIEKAMGDLGIAAPSYSLIELGTGIGTYSGLVVMLSVGAGFVIACIIFFGGYKSRKISLRDQFTGGEEPMPHMDKRYHYAWNFYAPYKRVLGPYFNDWVSKGYSLIYRVASQLGRLHRSIFNGDITAYIWVIFGTMVGIGILFWKFGGWF